MCVCVCVVCNEIIIYIAGKVMRELQRLFAYLILSNQKWVDPSALLKKLLDKNGQPVNIGNQEDVSG